MKTALRQTASWIADRELLLVLLAAPWLLFPEIWQPLTALALIFLPALWLARLIAGRPIHVVTPLNIPLLLLLLALGVAVRSAPIPSMAIRNATVIIFGVGIVSAFVNGGARWRRIQLWGVVLTVVGLVFALLSLTMTGWPQGKFASLEQISSRLPVSSLGLSVLPTSPVDPDHVAGVLVVLVPIVLGFSFHALERGRQPLMSHWQAYAAGGFLVALVVLFALVLTQSRTAYVVMLAVGVVVLGFRSRLVRVLVVALFVTVVMLFLIGLISGYLVDWMNVVDGLGRQPGAELSAWSRRVELWRNALLCVRDYPLSGAGLGAFRQVAPLNYPILESPPNLLPASVPNLWLHAGVDLGVLGLVAFAWLTAAILLMGWKIRLRRNGERILLTGFWLALLAWMGHGLLAGVWLAQPFGSLIWVVTGILLGGWLSEADESELVRPRRGLLQAVWVLGFLGFAVIVGWLFLSQILFLNQGAQRLDRALIDHTISTTERTRLLADAQRLLDQAGVLPGAVRRRAMLEYELGNHAQAAVAFHQDPRAKVYLFSRGRWLLASGRETEADHLLGVAMEAVSDSPRLACLRANVDWERDDPFGALDNYRRGLGLSATLDAEPEALVECHKGFARLAESLRWWDEAAESLARAAELDPGNLEYQRRYGWALFKATGELGEPVAILEGALRVKADSVPVMMTLIDIYLAAERPQKALEWSQSAVGVDSANAACWLRLAKAYAALEEFDQARSALAETLRLNPNYPEAISLQAQLEMP